MHNNDWNFYESAVEIELEKPDDFLKVRETLTRIGIGLKKQKILYQSCHILQKKKKYYLVHFKELFALDGKEAFSSPNDIARRNTIANLLADWKLLKLVNPERSKEPVVSIDQIKILRYDEKNDWKLIPKYSIGNVSNKKQQEEPFDMGKAFSESLVQASKEIPLGSDLDWLKGKRICSFNPEYVDKKD